MALSGMDKVAVVLATAAGVGYFPIASGTVGSLWGIVLRLSLGGPWVPAGLVLLAVLGVWSAGRFDEIHGTKDSGRIVIDEVLGMWLSALFFHSHTVTLVACFLLFRFYDVWKPWPVWQSQDLPAGLGVMADDVLAAGYTILTVAGLKAIGLL